MNFKDENMIVIDIEGELNKESYKTLKGNVVNLLHKNRSQIILNCENIDFIASSGIATLLSITKQVEENNGLFAIINLNNEITSLFTILGVTEYLHLYPQKKDAVAALQARIFDQPTIKQINTSEKSECTENKEDNQTERELPSEQMKLSDSENFENPIIIECAHCNALVRVYKLGEYMCPSCKQQFLVADDGTPEFY